MDTRSVFWYWMRGSPPLRGLAEGREIESVYKRGWERKPLEIMMRVEGCVYDLLNEWVWVCVCVCVCEEVLRSNIFFCWGSSIKCCVFGQLVNQRLYDYPRASLIRGCWSQPRLALHGQPADWCLCARVTPASTSIQKFSLARLPLEAAMDNAVLILGLFHTVHAVCRLDHLGKQTVCACLCVSEVVCPCGSGCF